MILRLRQSETAVLLLHMAMTRKSARNTFKRNHKTEAKELLESFDQVKAALEIIIEEAKESQDKINHLHFNINEIKLLQSFLKSYIPILSKTVTEAGSLEEDVKQIKVLDMIEKQSSKLLEGVSVV